MALEPGAVETVLVDSYGTLVDMAALREPLAAHAEDPEAVARLWHERSRVYGMTAALVGAYRPCREKYRHALRDALAARGVETTRRERDVLVAALDDLPAFDDVPGAIRRLRAAGYPVYVLSNGDPDMLEALIEGSGLAGVVSGTISAAEVETYKPHPDLYRHAASRAGTPPGRIVHATAAWNDVRGAMAVGMQGAWVERGGWWSGLLGRPDASVADLDGLAGELGA